jgi:hypothetical protein
MNTKIALTAIAIVSALALVVAPAMVGQPALAKKQQVCELPSGNTCPTTAVEEHNTQTTKECRAGKNFENTNPTCPK